MELCFHPLDDEISYVETKWNIASIICEFLFNNIYVLSRINSQIDFTKWVCSHSHKLHVRLWLVEANISFPVCQKLLCRVTLHKAPSEVNHVNMCLVPLCSSAKDAPIDWQWSVLHMAYQILCQLYKIYCWHRNRWRCVWRESQVSRLKQFGRKH